MRIGIGYDIHRLSEGRRLILGGVDIPFERGLAGHSDADVLLHAITDALLGAAALKDIGRRFPDTDPSYKDVDSRRLLKTAYKLICEAELTVENIDAIIVAERPKMAPYIEAMRKNISEDLGIEIGQISIKAKTNEGMDAVGRGEAIAVHAITLLRSA